MIVVCINDKFFITTKSGKYRRTKRVIVPRVGCYYEVTGHDVKFIEGADRVFFYLREFPDGSKWHCSFFREVDIDISEATEILKKQTEIYQEIEVEV